MSLKQLRYLIAVAECLHFSRAAERCAVTQPTLSVQMRKLEEYLGVRLFDRDHSRVCLTAGGEDVLRRARHIIAAVDELLVDYRQVHGQIQGALPAVPEFCRGCENRPAACRSPMRRRSGNGPR
jgi:DNA-binding transcriptional LysR family regulator